jgi:hypothetical protein
MYIEPLVGRSEPPSSLAQDRDHQQGERARVLPTIEFARRGVRTASQGSHPWRNSACPERGTCSRVESSMSSPPKPFCSRRRFIAEVVGGQGSKTRAEPAPRNLPIRCRDWSGNLVWLLLLGVLFTNSPSSSLTPERIGRSHGMHTLRPNPDSRERPEMRLVTSSSVRLLPFVRQAFNLNRCQVSCGRVQQAQCESSEGIRRRQFRTQLHHRSANISS